MQQLRVRLRNSSAARRQLLPRIAIIIIAVVVAAVVGHIWLPNSLAIKRLKQENSHRISTTTCRLAARSELRDEVIKRNS